MVLKRSFPLSEQFLEWFWRDWILCSRKMFVEMSLKPHLIAYNFQISSSSSTTNAWVGYILIMYSPSISRNSNSWMREVCFPPKVLWVDWFTGGSWNEVEIVRDQTAASSAIGDKKCCSFMIFLMDSTQTTSYSPSLIVIFICTPQSYHVPTENEQEVRRCSAY